jgi:hypothetical protein
MITWFKCWKKTRIQASNQVFHIVFESPASHPPHPCQGGLGSFSFVWCYHMWAVTKPSEESRFSVTLCWMVSEEMNAVPPRWEAREEDTHTQASWTDFGQYFNNILSYSYSFPPLQPPPPLIMQSDWIPLKIFSQLQEKTGICHLSASILLPVSLQHIFQSWVFAATPCPLTFDLAFFKSSSLYLLIFSAQMLHITLTSQLLGVTKGRPGDSPKAIRVTKVLLELACVIKRWSEELARHSRPETSKNGLQLSLAKMFLTIPSLYLQSLVSSLGLVSTLSSLS